MNMLKQKMHSSTEEQKFELFSLRLNVIEIIQNITLFSVIIAIQKKIIA